MCKLRRPRRRWRASTAPSLPTARRAPARRTQWRAGPATAGTGAACRKVRVCVCVCVCVRVVRRATAAPVTLPGAHTRTNRRTRTPARACANARSRRRHPARDQADLRRDRRGRGEAPPRAAFWAARRLGCAQLFGGGPSARLASPLQASMDTARPRTHPRHTCSANTNTNANTHATGRSGTAPSRCRSWSCTMRS